MSDETRRGEEREPAEQRGVLVDHHAEQSEQKQNYRDEKHEFCDHFFLPFLTLCPGACALEILAEEDLL